MTITRKHRLITECPRCIGGHIMVEVGEPFCVNCGWREPHEPPDDEIPLQYTVKSARLQVRNDDIFNRFMAGEPLAKLAQEYNLSADYVSDILRQQGRKMGAGSTWKSRMPGVHSRSKNEKPLSVAQIKASEW